MNMENSKTFFPLFLLICVLLSLLYTDNIRPCYKAINIYLSFFQSNLSTGRWLALFLCLWDIACCDPLGGFSAHGGAACSTLCVLPLKDLRCAGVLVLRYLGSCVPCLRAGCTIRVRPWPVYATLNPICIAEQTTYEVEVHYYIP